MTQQNNTKVSIAFGLGVAVASTLLASPSQAASFVGTPSSSSLSPIFCLAFRSEAVFFSPSSNKRGFIQEWNLIAHPFKWTQQSTTKILAKCEIVNSNNITKIVDAIAV